MALRRGSGDEFKATSVAAVVSGELYALGDTTLGAAQDDYAANTKGAYDTAGTYQLLMNAGIVAGSSAGDRLGIDFSNQEIIGWTTGNPAVILIEKITVGATTHGLVFLNRGEPA